jgi:hypothetical protein
MGADVSELDPTFPALDAAFFFEARRCKMRTLHLLTTTAGDYFGRRDYPESP